MSKRLDKRADLLLMQHGFDVNGKKVKRRKLPVKKVKKVKAYDSKTGIKILKKNKDLIACRKGSELSDMEMSIATFLSRNEVFFIREYYAKGLYNPKTKMPLFFDFYLPKYNLVIEYDGIHHFKNKDAHQLEQQKAKDSIKNIFCAKRKINLLRIPYWKQKRFEYLILERIDEITK